MKLFEYTALIEVRTAIAAETREEADAIWSQIYRPDFPEASRLVSADVSEIVEISDGELVEITDLPGLWDEGDLMKASVTT